jgi:septum formation protein
MNAIEKQLKSFPYKLILASASPRRQELLKSLGFSFTVKPVKADEDSWPKHLSAEQIPLWLADLKANSYSESLKPDELLITADTIVWCENEIYNKPVDFQDGSRMLASLSGKMHEVFTAVCLKSASKQRSFCDVSRVYFKTLSEEEIEYYLINYKPYDKAGAYGVQDWLGYTAIERIEGSFYNVMGLPVKLLYEELMKFV